MKFTGKDWQKTNFFIFIIEMSQFKTIIWVFQNTYFQKSDCSHWHIRLDHCNANLYWGDHPWIYIKMRHSRMKHSGPKLPLSSRAL